MKSSKEQVRGSLGSGNRAAIYPEAADGRDALPNVVPTVSHIFCEGRSRGFSFDVWLHGWRVAEAWYQADYFFQWIKPVEPRQGVLV